MKTFTNRKIRIGDNTRTKVRRISSHRGDVILQCNKTDAGGEVVETEIIMFVPKIITTNMELEE